MVGKDLSHFGQAVAASVRSISRRPLMRCIDWVDTAKRDRGLLTELGMMSTVSTL